MVTSENLEKINSSANMAGLKPIYTQEDVQEILQIALDRQGGDISRSQLLEIAADLNISVSQIEKAEQEWLSRQGEKDERQLFAIHRQKKFNNNLVKYGIFNTFFLLLNLGSSGHLSWSLYIALFWGLGVALQGWRNYQRDGEEYEQAFQNWRVRQQLGKSFSTFFTKLEKWLS